jgi:putative spermidine/putrescine transport system permease protein
MRPGPDPRLRRALALAPALCLVVLLVGAGLAGAVRASLGVTRRAGWGAADLDAYRRLASDPLFWEALRFTLQTAALATAVSVVLALALAAPLRRAGTTGRVLAAVPVAVPHLVAAVLAVAWIGPGGLADRLVGGLPVDLVRDPLGLGVVLVYVVKETPFLALLVLAVWTPAVAAREEAAAVLGASPAQRLAWVVWPALRGPLVTGAAIVAAFVVGALEVPRVVGPTGARTLAEYAVDATRTAGVEGRATANAALLVATAIALALAGVAAATLRGRHA